MAKPARKKSVGSNPTEPADRVSEVEAECEDLRTALESAKEEIERSAAEVDRLTGEVENLTVDAETSTRTVAALIDQLKSSETHVEQLQKLLTVADEKAARLAQVTRELGEYQEQLATTHEEMLAGHDELRIANEQLEENKTLLERRVIERTAALTNYVGRLRAVVDTAPNGVVTIDQDGIVEEFNPAAQKMFGYNAEQVVGRNVKMLMPARYADEHDTYLKRFLETGAAKVLGTGRRLKAQRKDGSLFPIHLTIGEVTVDHRRVFTGFIEDLSELASAQQSATEARTFLGTVMSVAELIFVVVAPDGSIERVNRKCEQLTGYTANELIGRPVLDLIPADQQPGVGRVIESLVANRLPSHYENDWLAKDGTRHRILWSNTTLTGADGEVQYVIGTGLDVTGQRRIETKLDEVQLELYRVARLGDLGEMASAIAHELNQPLAAMSNFAGAALAVAKKDAGTPPRAVELVGKAIAQAERAGQIVRRLRQLIGRNEVELALVDVNSLVRDAATLALIGAGEKNISTHWALADDLPPARADRTQVQQVVFNLVRNGVDAMALSGGGALTIATELSDGDIAIAVSDNGPGLAPEVADKLFTAFVTTKTDGMGIGLAICKSIVEAHGGRIWVTPNPDGGVTFRFTLKRDGDESDDPG